MLSVIGRFFAFQLSVAGGRNAVLLFECGRKPVPVGISAVSGNP